MTNEFEEAAREAGFTEAQIAFLDEWLAKYPHTHDMTEVEGLPEALDELGEDEEEEEE
jgi:hypothetical protein